MIGEPADALFVKDADGHCPEQPDCCVCTNSDCAFNGRIIPNFMH